MLEEARLEVHNAQPHAIHDDGQRLRCAICQKFISSKAPLGLRKIFAAGACQGRLAAQAIQVSADRGRVKASGVPSLSGHTLLQTGGIVWCNVCGCFSEERLKGLKADCKGPPRVGGRITSLGRLRSGRHPRTNIALSEVARPATRSSSELCM